MTLARVAHVRRHKCPNVPAPRLAEPFIKPFTRAPGRRPDAAAPGRVRVPAVASDAYRAADRQQPAYIRRNRPQLRHPARHRRSARLRRPGASDRDLAAAGARGSTWIRTAEADRAAAAGSADFLTFELRDSSTVYVGHDIRIAKKPDWLATEFMDTGMQLQVGSDLFELYSNVYAAHASVTLGSNISADGADRSHMYLVFVVPAAAEREPPTPPASVQAVCASAAVVGLSWRPSTDAVKVAGYRITRDGVLLGTTASPYFSDTTVSASTPYTYVVIAFGAGGSTAASTPIPVTTQAASAAGDAPYCSSRLIGGMNWSFSNGYTQANGSDLWPAAWGADGNVYFFFGDGGGFGGDNERGRASFGIATISGEPPPTIATMHNVYGGYASAHAAQVSGKASALIAIGADFYAIAGIYRPTDPKSAYPHEPSGSPDHLEIASSLGNAYSWRDGEWTFCGVESERGARVVSGAFCPQGFVSYGAGNARRPRRVCLPLRHGR